MISRVFLITAVLVAGSGRAQDRQPADAFMEAFAPGAEHAFLASLDGDWDVEGRLRFDADAPWETFRATARFEMILSGS